MVNFSPKCWRFSFIIAPQPSRLAEVQEPPPPSISKYRPGCHDLWQVGKRQLEAFFLIVADFLGLKGGFKLLLSSVISCQVNQFFFQFGVNWEKYRQIPANLCTMYVQGTFGKFKANTSKFNRNVPGSIAEILNGRMSGDLKIIAQIQVWHLQIFRVLKTVVSVEIALLYFIVWTFALLTLQVCISVWSVHLRPSGEWVTGRQLPREGRGGRVSRHLHLSLPFKT